MGRKKDLRKVLSTFPNNRPPLFFCRRQLDLIWSFYNLVYKEATAHLSLYSYSSLVKSALLGG